MSELEHFGTVEVFGPPAGYPEPTMKHVLYAGTAGSEPYLTVAGPAPRRGTTSVTTAPHYLGTLRLRGSHVETSAHDRVGRIVGGRMEVGDVWIGSKKSDIGRRTRIHLEAVAHLVNVGPLLEKFREHATRTHRAAVKRYKEWGR